MHAVNMSARPDGEEAGQLLLLEQEFTKRFRRAVLVGSLSCMGLLFSALIVAQSAPLETRPTLQICILKSHTPLTQLSMNKEKIQLNWVQVVSGY